MKKLASTSILIAAFFLSVNLFAQIGNVDAAFMANVNNPGGFNDAVYALAVQSDGKILVGGEFSSYNGTQSSCLIRLNADGTIDNTFNVGNGFRRTNPTPRPYVHTITIQTDGKILVGGFFNTYNDTAKGNIVRLNANGSIDNSFTPTGTTDPVRQIVIQPNDSKILVVGDFTQFNGVSKGRVTRLELDGSTDNTFTPTGASGRVWTVKVQDNDQILVGGEFTSMNGSTAHGYFAKLNSNGSLDQTFTTTINNTVRCISILQDDKILVGGAFTAPSNRLSRLNDDGTTDTGFIVGQGFDEQVLAIVPVQNPGGTYYYVTGSFSTFNGFNNPARRIMAMGSTGGIFFDFPRGIDYGFETNVFALERLPDGNLITGGAFQQYKFNATNNVTPRIAKLNGVFFCDETYSDVIPATACNSYTAVNGEVFTTGGMKFVTLLGANAQGCDSIVRINLTLNTISATATVYEGQLYGEAIPMLGTSFLWYNCDTEQPIFSQTNPTYTPNTSGNYAVIATNNNCSDTSSCVAFSTSVGVEDLKSDHIKFQIYPNPTTAVLTIEVDESVESIEVADILGRVIIAEKNPSTLNPQRSIADLSNGTYFIHLRTTNGKTAVKSFVKQ